MAIKPSENSSDSPQPDAHSEADSSPLTGGRTVVNSAQLFGGANEVLIRHNGELYLLRHTSKGKLILTK